MDVEQIVNS